LIIFARKKAYHMCFIPNNWTVQVVLAGILQIEYGKISDCGSKKQLRSIRRIYVQKMGLFIQ